MPVLPLVGSTIVAPGLTRPCASADSSIARPIRSLTLPPGFSDSSLATTLAPPGRGSRFRRTIGVWPISSSTDDAVFDLGDRLADLFPELTELVRLVAVAPPRPAARLERRRGPLDGAQHVPDTDLLG